MAVKTQVPGKQSIELGKLREQYIPRGISNATPIVAERAKGAELWDVDGNRYLDFAGGIGVQNTGHLPEKVMQAAREQMEKLTHTCFQVTMYESYIRLAERLSKLVPVEGAVKTALFTTGAEAVENAIKIARFATKRRAVIAFDGAFHGRTLLGMSLTGKTSYRAGFGPTATDVYHIPYPNTFKGWDTEKVMAALEELYLYQIPANEVAAIIVEPVQGEGGFIPVPEDFFKALREHTHKHGMILIDDEIQSGMGRTGKMYALEHYGIKADMVLTAKSLAAGFPLSAVSGKAEIMDAPASGGLGGTYAGNPIACAAALAVLDMLENDGLLQQAQALAHTLQQRFAVMQAKHSCIADVRGLGAMIAMELEQNGKPASDLTARICKIAYERGLILIKAGIHANVIRVLVPVSIEASQLNEALGILEDAFVAALDVAAV